MLVGLTDPPGEGIGVLEALHKLVNEQRLHQSGPNPLQPCAILRETEALAPRLIWMALLPTSRRGIAGVIPGNDSTFTLPPRNANHPKRPAMLWADVKDSAAEGVLLVLDVVVAGSRAVLFDLPVQEGVGPVPDFGGN